MGISPDCERHGQKQKEPGTYLGKMSPQQKQGNQRNRIREASEKRNLVRSERGTQSREKFEMPKDDYGMLEHYERRVPE
jgi:hypothetical protein